jgi:RimJ/RimL family protein N-acetyltransferase
MSEDPAWTLRTERLVLEPVAPRHEAELVAFHADARVMATMRHGPLDADAARALVASYAADWAKQGWGVRVMRRAADGAFVGLCGLWNREDGRGIALRFAVAQEAQGQGYAREAARATVADAFARIGIARVVAIANESNAASQRALEGAGFVESERFESRGKLVRLYAIGAPVSSASGRAAGAPAADR